MGNPKFGMSRWKAKSMNILGCFFVHNFRMIENALPPPAHTHAPPHLHNKYGNLGGGGGGYVHTQAL